LVLDGLPGWRLKFETVQHEADQKRNLLDVVGDGKHRAASRADCMAGRRRAIKMPMMAMTTNSSIKLKPLWREAGCRAVYTGRLLGSFAVWPAVDQK
jgi:hypothetical protein